MNEAICGVCKACKGKAALKTGTKSAAAEALHCEQYFSHGKTATCCKKHYAYDEVDIVKAGDEAATTEMCLSSVMKCRCTAKEEEKQVTPQESLNSAAVDNIGVKCVTRPCTSKQCKEHVYSGDTTCALTKEVLFMGLTCKGQAVMVATTCMGVQTACEDGQCAYPDQNVRASADLKSNFTGLCAPGLALCESCEKNHTKTSLTVLEAAQEE